MASTEEAIGKGTKSVENSLLKGAGFHKNNKVEEKHSTPVPRPTEKATAKNLNKTAEVDNFEALDDDDKKCYSYVAKNYDGIAYPENWASKHAITSGLSEKGLANAANKFRKDFNNSKMDTNEVLKYPFWSAARDWNPEVIGGLGNKISSGLDSYKFDPDMARQVQNVFR